MSREIDERVVAMYFDNKDFERNVGTTLKTLGKLKEASDMEGSAKSFETLEKAAKKMDLGSVRRNAEGLRSSLGSLGNVVSKAFNVGTAPVRSLENLFNTFRNYAAKFIGFDIAGKFVSTMENALRQMTIAPIEAGWDMYQNRMDSIKTIMSGSGEDLDTVTAKLDKLTQYANKTIYSLSDMTSNIGKFTNNGVKLEKAASSMMGIANATALAGQGAQQASMAMYNISQAIGVGAMTTIDWKSIENANIATQKLKQTLIDVAVAKGQLTKVEEKDKQTGELVTKYFVKGLEKGKKKTEVSVQNFRETLQKKWLDADTMVETFTILSGELTKEEIERMGYTEKEAEELYQLGQEALKAATEVRTFSKMWDALKESVQSGWATSMEYIFGDMEEGTTMWTHLNDVFSGILDKNAETRNQILLAWRGLEKQEDGTLKRVSQKDGRQIMLNTLDTIINTVQRFSGIFSNAWESVFGKMTGEKLYNFTVKIADGFKKISTWLGSAKQEGSNVSKLTKFVGGLLNVVKLLGRGIKTVFDLGKRLIGPVADVVVDIFGKIGEFLSDIGDMNFIEILEKLGKGLGDAWEAVKKFFSPTDLYDQNGFLLNEKGDSPFVSAIKGLWNNLKSTIRQWADDNGITAAWDQFVAAATPIFTKISEFLKEPISWITTQFSPTEDDGSGDTRSPAERFLSDIWNGITSVWEDIVGWEGWNAISSFLSDTINWVVSQFTPTTRYDANGHELSDRRSPAEKFLSNIWDGITSVWEDIVTWEGWSAVSSFLSDTVNWVVSQFTPKTRHDINGHELSDRRSPAEKFLDEIWDGIKTVWGKIVEWPLWTQVSDFISNTAKWITDQFSPKKRYDERGFELNDHRSPVGEFLENIWESISAVWDDIKKWPFWSQVSNFLNNTIAWITDQFSPKKRYDDRGFELNDRRSPAEEFLGNIWEGIKSTWNAIKKWPIWTQVSTFLNNTVTWIADQFSSKRRYDDRGFELNDRRSPAEEFLGNIWEGIKSTWNAIKKWPVWTQVSTFLNNTISWVADQFSPKRRYDDKGFELNDDRSPAAKFLGDIWDGIKSTWQKILKWPIWTQVSKFINNTIAWVTDQFSTQRRYDDRGFELNDHRSPVEKFLGDIWDGIKSTWNKVVAWEGWAAISQFFTNTFEWIKGLFNNTETSTAGSNGPAELVKNVTEQVNTAAEAAGGDGKVEEKTDFLTTVIGAIGEFFGKVSEFAGKVTDIPVLTEFLTSAGTFLEGMASFLSKTLAWIGRILGNKTKPGDIEQLGGILGILFGSKIMGLFTTKYRAQIGGIESVGKQFMEISIGILAVASAVALLSTVDEAAMWKGVAGVGVITLVVSYLVGNIAKLKDASAEVNPATTAERIWKKVIGTVERLGMVAIAFSMLPNIINALASAKQSLGENGKDFGKDFLDLMLGVVTAVGGIALTLGLIEKLTGGNGLSPKATLKTMVSLVEIIAITLAAFGAGGALAEGINALAGGDDAAGGSAHSIIISGLQKLGEFMGEVGAAFGSFLEGLKMGRKRVEEKTIEEQMDWLEKVGAEIQVEKILKVVQAASVLARVTDSLEKYQLNPDKIENLIDFLGGYDAHMGLGAAIASFITSVNQVANADNMDIDLDKVKIIGETIRAFADAANAIQDFASYDLMSMIKLDEDATGTTMFDKVEFYARAAARLAEAINEGLDGKDINFDVTPIVDSLILELTNSSNSIATAVHNMVQTGIDNANTDSGGGAYTGVTGTVPFSVDVTGLDGLMSIDNLNLFGTDANGNQITTVDGLMKSMFGDSMNFDLTQYTGNMEEQLAGFGATLKDNLSMPDWQSQWNEFLTPSDDGSGSGYDKLLADMQEKVGAIGTELQENNTFEISIVPVLDTEALTNALAAGQAILNGSPLFTKKITAKETDVDLSASMQNVAGEIQATNEKLDLLIGAVEKINTDEAIRKSIIISRIADVRDSFSNTRVYLDSGLLVGALTPGIDRELYRRYITAGRTGVSV